MDMSSGTGTGRRYKPLALRIACSIYLRSPAAFRAMDAFKIFSFPTERTLKSYMGAFKHGAGVDPMQFEIFRRARVEMEEKRHALGFASAENEQQEVIVIMDEIKGKAKVFLNRSNGTLIGFVGASLDDLISLKDLFSVGVEGDPEMEDPADKDAGKAVYYLQTLIRPVDFIVCLKWSSGLYHSHSVAVSFNHSIVFVLSVLLFSFVNNFDYDVIGPYWSSDGPASSLVIEHAHRSTCKALLQCGFVRLPLFWMAPRATRRLCATLYRAHSIARIFDRGLQ